MPNTLTIKPIYNEYCPQIIDIVLTIQRVEFGLPITLKEQPDLLDIETNYHEGGGCFWGAFVGEELVGTISLINAGHHTCAIRKMFVKQQYRGKELGIAQKLLDTLLQYSRDKQITEVYLGTVEALKAAHRFYERNDFVATDINDLPAYFPLMATDTMFYHLHLNN